MADYKSGGWKLVPQAIPYTSKCRDWWHCSNFRPQSVDYGVTWKQSWFSYHWLYKYLFSWLLLRL